ncbi:hypothetical protein [Actinoplanes sp. NPDC049316]|uniref:hypothetical protein n=1 Tax=Actinoplanes sp. NPDC049316 TaxID=3154727 RepID=UPI00343425CF
MPARAGEGQDATPPVIQDMGIAAGTRVNKTVVVEPIVSDDDRTADGDLCLVLAGGTTVNCEQRPRLRIRHCWQCRSNSPTWLPGKTIQRP